MRVVQHLWYAFLSTHMHMLTCVCVWCVCHPTTTVCAIPCADPPMYVGHARHTTRLVMTRMCSVWFDLSSHLCRETVTDI